MIMNSVLVVKWLSVLHPKSQIVFCNFQSSLNPSMGFVPMSPRLSSPAHPSSGGGAGGGGGGRGRGRGEDRRNSGLIGQTVRIVQGPYKGK